MLLNILLLTLLGSVISLFGGIALLLPKKWSPQFSLKLTSFAAGVLLATAFWDLFPEAVEHMDELGQTDVFTPAFIAIISFFLLERTLVWFHHHHTDDHGSKPTILMITLGDGLHNFIDGVAISAAYIINPTVGLATTLAVAAHEIPQEIADFSILLSQGLSKSRAIFFNIISALTAFLGATSMYLFSEKLETHLGTIIAFTAGMFVYISLSDLIPELHHTKSRKDTIPQIIMFILGIILVYTMKSFIGNFVHAV